MRILKWIAIILAIITPAAISIDLFAPQLKNGIHEEEYSKGDYIIDLIHIKGVKDGVVFIAINKTDFLMSKGENHIMENKGARYMGSIEIIDVKDERVTLKMNVNKNMKYYVINYVMIILLSILLLVLTNYIFGRIHDNKEVLTGEK